MNTALYIEGLAAMVALAVLTWILSVFKRDVSIVDSIWSLMICAGGAVYSAGADAFSARSALIFSLLVIWALRLAIYITWRNWGETEDHRYRQIRAKYDPHFAFKSLFIIFLLQTLLAWIISLPLWAAITTDTSMQLLDGIAMILWLVGMGFETIGDRQLARFKADPANRGKVLDHGLWHYTRHPNYFGEALIWWGFYLFALAAGAWWTLPAALLMTWLLLKFSGVVILEESIVDRRPAYKQYIETTNAFIPGPRKQPQQPAKRGQSS